MYLLSDGNVVLIFFSQITDDKFLQKVHFPNNSLRHMEQYAKVISILLFDRTATNIIFYAKVKVGMSWNLMKCHKMEQQCRRVS